MNVEFYSQERKELKKKVEELEKRVKKLEGKLLKHDKELGVLVAKTED